MLDARRARLVNRSTRKLSLPAEGQGFLDHARPALRLLDEAVADVSQTTHQPAGRGRISVKPGGQRFEFTP